MPIETTNRTNEVVGLYYEPKSDQYLGALDENTANGFVRVGYELVKEGREAAEMTTAQINATYRKKKGTTNE